MVHHPLSAQNQSEKALQSMPRRDGGPMGDHATSIFCYDDPRVVKRCTEKSYSVDLSIYIIIIIIIIITIIITIIIVIINIIIITIIIITIIIINILFYLCIYLFIDL